MKKLIGIIAVMLMLLAIKAASIVGQLTKFSDSETVSETVSEAASQTAMPPQTTETEAFETVKEEAPGTSESPKTETAGLSGEAAAPSEDDWQEPVTVHVRLEETEAVPQHPIVMGDSRTVCLYCSMTYSAEEYPKHVFYSIDPEYAAAYEDTTFVAKGGEGDAWFETYGLAKGVAYLDEHSVLVVWFGVNDLNNANRYISYINGVALSFGVPVYYMTIGPCDKGWADNNAAVESFNAALEAGLDPAVHRIDMYSYIRDGMVSGRFATMDGLHYDYETSRAIYQYMMDEIAAAEILAQEP